MLTTDNRHLAVKPSIADVIRFHAHRDETLMRHDENKNRLVLVFRRPPSQRAGMHEKFRFVTCEWVPTPDNADYFWRPIAEVSV